MQITRRTFITGSAASLALLAIELGSKGYFNQFVADAAGSANEEWKAAFCVACLVNICGTQIKVEDGIATDIKGDPNCPINEGRLCPRGTSVINGLYNPYRVKAPLKRTNPEKGLDIDPGWVEITWEEALNTVAEKLKEAKAYHPGSFIMHTGFGNGDSLRRIPIDRAIGSGSTIMSAGMLCPDHYGPFASQGTKVDRADLEHCNLLLNIGRTVGDEYVVASFNSNDYVKAVERGMKVIVVNPKKTLSGQNGEWVPILPGTDTAFAWALLHSMIYEIGKFDEEYLKRKSNAPYLIEDKPQVFKGTKVFLEDFFRDATSGKPLVWDEQLNKPVPFDSSKGDTYALFGSYEINGKKVKTALQLVKEYIADFTPEWAEKITTIPAAKIREIAQEMVEAAQIGSTITIDGHVFPLRPVATYLGKGADCNPMCTEIYKALTTINVILGCVDVPGGSLANSTGDITHLFADADGLLVPAKNDFMRNQYVGQEKFQFPPDSFRLDCFYPMQLAMTQVAFKAICDPKSYHVPFEAKVLCIYAGNSIASNCNPEYYIEGMKKIPFTFQLALWLDETTQFADIVLAEHHPLERTAFKNNQWITNKVCSDRNRGMRAFHARRPVVEPMHNTMLGEDILIELADRAGVLPGVNMAINHSFQYEFFGHDAPGLAPEFELKPNQKYMYDDMVERKIKSVFGPQSGWHDFEKCAVKTFSLPTIKETYNSYWFPDVRVPVYYPYSARNIKTIMEGCKEHGINFPHADIEEVAKNYSATPVFYEFDTMLPNQEYPFKAFAFKMHFMVHDCSGLVSNPMLREVLEKYNSDYLKIWIPAAAGKSMGIKENDKIVVESPYGKTEGLAHLSEMIHPQSVGIGGKWGRKAMHMAPHARKGASFNWLLNNDEKDIGFPMGNLNNSVHVKIYKA